MREPGPFDPEFLADERAASAAAAADPQPGMGFHEMWSFWTFVTDVTEHTVQVVRGGGHPSWFPECGTAQVVPRTEFPTHVRHQVLSDRRYETAGWAARAEGLTRAELEQRARAGMREGR